ncbi:hypothetical protein [Hugenholtzia roseola]|uniref:hypothetical protein n=1 Tax=Hugenholtzia roseola TaxID=1002 RepID=UPI000478F453|nr:hypothetical protein [Hugenholtzia roseola]
MKVQKMSFIYGSRLFLIVFLLLFWVAIKPMSFAKTEPFFVQAQDFGAYWVGLKESLLQEEKNLVANQYINYPFYFYQNTFQNSTEFLAEYEQVFSPEQIAALVMIFESDVTKEGQGAVLNLSSMQRRYFFKKVGTGWRCTKIEKM